MTKRHGVGYARFSRLGKRDAEHLRTIDAQSERNEDVANENGITLVANFSDHGKSGGSLDGRDGLMQALQMIDSGEASVLVAARLSRLARSVPDLRKIIERVDQVGGSIVLGDLGRIDMKSSMGKMLVQIVGALAEFELDLAREHGTDSRKHAISNGKHTGRRVPWGYERDENAKLTPCKTRGPVVTEIFKRRAGGASWREISEYVLAMTGDVLQPATMNKMLENRVYLGEVKSGEFVNENAHEALIDVETFDEVRAARPRRSTRKHGALLAGLMTCSGCGRPMTYRASARQQQYMCQRNSIDGRCPAPVGVSAQKADEAVVASFLAWSDRVVIADPDNVSEITEANDALALAEGELDAWLDRPVAGIDRARWEAQTTKRQNAVDAARARVAELRRDRRLDVMRMSVADLWPTLDNCERHKLLAAAVEKIVVHPSPNPGSRTVAFSDRAEIVWRD